MSGIMSMLLGAVSSAAAAVDEFFNRVTLLLPGNGTNGAQNNTFLDSSSNNFTITRNGNTTQGTFSPFSQTGWSNGFSVSGTYLTATQSAFAAASDFTVEAWFWQNNQTSGFQGIVSTSTSGNSSGFRITTDNGTLTLWVNNSSVTSASVPQNQWNHVAISRTGTSTNNISCYLNGVRVGQFTNTSSTTNTTLTVGRYYYDLANYYIDGYISNVRLVVGSGLYSGSTISVPTTPLTAVSGTQVLTCQSNRFIDSSSNAFALTVNGTLSVQPFSPFLPTVAYTPQTIGGSGYFDGTGDNLVAPNNTALAMGTGDFQIEFWAYHTSIPAGFTYIDTRPTGTNGSYITLGYNNSGNGIFLYVNTMLISTGITPVANSWTHFVLSRVGSTTRLFRNGSQIGSATDGTNYAIGAQGMGIGANTISADNYFPGYISEFRVVKGSGVTSVTVPTAPLTAITNTTLLLNFTNAGITDATAKNVLETVGNAQISTTQSKFGGSSMYFDGTGDYLVAPSSQNYAFVTGDFTVEFWIFLAAGSKSQVILDTRASGPSSNGIAIAIDTSNNPYVYVNSATLFTSSTALSLNTWTHVAVVKSSGTITLYLNGTKPSTGSGSSSTSLTDTALTIGTAVDYRDTTTTLHLNGYIDDLRITKGFARYTANFTAPTAALPLQ